MADDLDTAQLNKVINEEYKIWKKNSPFLYDLVITHALDWPSLTCQWLPDKETPAGKDYTVHRLILGTHTSGGDKNYLQIASVNLPKATSSTGSSVRDTTAATSAEKQLDKYDTTKGEIGEYSDTEPRIKIVQSIIHDGEVNRARYMPQNQDLIATKTAMGNVLVFDRTKHPNQPKEDDDKCRPDITLRGHTKEGYGLAWNATSAGEGHLLSASEDTTVCHWDIKGYTKANSVLEPLRVYRGHTAVVEDVAWKPDVDNIFASVGDDRQLMLWDTRGSGSSGNQPTSKIEAHSAEVNCVAFSPSSPNHFLTGSADKTIGLWDIRNLKSKLHTFIHHQDEVLGLAWSPTNETIFASSSSDRRVMLWDVSKIGLEQPPEDIEDGPPELLFMHGGHTSRPTDLSWSPNANWHLATTSEDNVLQVWQPSRTIYAADKIPISVE
ncbi:WD40 repeat-like protein [Cystobasidium minutum MCA 4210]|uniref:WD40 repeat-like protein n=1 Tax=Cystobasidium minutum MCA 4210 TaxID=1397322 RepID=UPI0034CFD582|eukprot:jgi/Rhomi1/182658/fgenesh1_pm.1_\